jgi:hypothetical protein
VHGTLKLPANYKATPGGRGLTERELHSAAFVCASEFFGDDSGVRLLDDEVSPLLLLSSDICCSLVEESDWVLR